MTVKMIVTYKFYLLVIALQQVYAQWYEITAFRMVCNSGHSMSLVTALFDRSHDFLFVFFSYYASILLFFVSILRFTALTVR